MPPYIVSLLIYTLLPLFLASVVLVIYFWVRKKQYTREKFAITGFLSLIGMTTFYLACLYSNTSILGYSLKIFSGLAGKPITAVPPLTPIEAITVLVIFVSLIYAYIQIFVHWDGQKSIAQHEQEQNRETANALTSIILLLKRDKRLEPYQENSQTKERALERPESLAWHERSKALWSLRHPSYLFREEDQYDPTHKCWFGEEKNTGALLVLACYQDEPPMNTIEKLIEYTQKVGKRRNQNELEFVISLKNRSKKDAVEINGYSLQYTNAEELLDKLVDFSNYFDDLRYRVEKAKLVESDLTLQETYTPSFFCLEEHREAQFDYLETYIENWLKENTRRQLAVLGEYGQGKSTVSLMLSYNLMKQITTGSQFPIPILIELRGKTIRTLEPDELLAVWASRYSINPKALHQLHMAGKLLLIFEGFDEIDLSGAVEARVEHFRKLWRFNYEQSKIIITGRPNFFLDTEELKIALGKEEETETLYLSPFTIGQIEESLRGTEKPVRDGILALAKTDPKFHEVVSRPSLLFNVMILWKDKLASRQKEIHSALVIDLFIEKTLQRQQDKHDKRAFMVLNSAERRYFMAGIAAYMAKKGLPNQIGKRELEDAVEKLVTAIPDEVSRSVSSVNNEESAPLKNNDRFEWETNHDEIMAKINNDVRSCGLLVTDFSKDGTFKFSHKSYMEFLQAQVISQLSSSEKVEQVTGKSIVNTWNLGLRDLEKSDEAIGFLAELLKERLYKDGLEEKFVAKGLWDILVAGKISPNHKFKSFLTNLGISFANFLTNGIISVFGLKNREMTGLLLLLLLFVVAVGGAAAVGGAVAELAVVGGAGVVVVVVGIGVGIGVGVGVGVVVAGEVVVGVVVGVGIGVGVVGKMFINELTELHGWFLPEALLFVISIFILMGIVSFTLILTSSFFLNNKNTLFNRMSLWYRTCLNLRLPSKNIEGVVGKGVVVLIEEKSKKYKNVFFSWDLGDRTQ